MKPQIIQSLEGKDEYVLLPVPIYIDLQEEIDAKLAKFRKGAALTEYITNPIIQARLNADITQQELAEKMNVSQAYISKLEKQQKVSAKVLAKVDAALKK